MMKHYVKRHLIAGCMLALALLFTACGSSAEETPAESVPEEKPVEDTGITIGELEAASGTDIVLVMDESGSMLKSDKSRLAIEGAKLFIDMEKLTTANIALVQFSNTISSTGMIDVTKAENKEFLKGILSDVVYVAKNHTDTGAGMLQAIDELNRSGDYLNKSIILFTDGRTDIDVGTPGRTTEDSENDANTAAQLARDAGYKIYCIGLNEDGSVDVDALERMAVTTGGKYLIANNVDEITGFFEEIFGAIRDSEVEDLDQYVADGEFREVDFSIDDKNIIESNIVILSSKSLDDLELINPSGAVVDLQSDDGYIYTASEKYTLVKIIMPDLGNWKIRVKGVEGDSIRISKISNYDMNLMADVSATKVIMGSDVIVDAYLASSGKVVNDSDYYQKLSGYINVKDVNGNKEKQVDLVVNEDGTKMRGIFTTDAVTTYEMRIHVQSSGFFRDSDSFYVESFKNPPTVLKPKTDLELTVGKTEEIDLNQYFSDPDGAEMTYAIVGDVDDELIGAELKDNTLEITGCSEGIANVTFAAENGSPEKASATIAVTVKKKINILVFVLIPVAVILLVLLLILLVKQASKKLTGVFECNVESHTINNAGTPSVEKFEIVNTLDQQSLGRRGFTAKKLLEVFGTYYGHIEFDQASRERFNACAGAVKSDAAKVKIKGTGKEFVIRIVSGSKNVRFVENNLESSKKSLDVSLANSKFGVVPVMEKSFGIKFVQGDTPSYVQINIKYRKM